MARLHGYQCPPRGGRGRCRRACERTPLRGRRRCAAGGRLTHHTPQASYIFPLTPLTHHLPPSGTRDTDILPHKRKTCLEMAGLRIHIRLQEERPLPLRAADTHPASDTRIKILVTSTPPSHTINRAELAGIDIDLQPGHTHLLTDSACSLRLIQGNMNCPSAYRHNINRDTLFSITHTP
jgi:hypothetical protein